MRRLYLAKGLFWRKAHLLRLISFEGDLLEFCFEIYECLGSNVLWCDDCDVIHVGIDFAAVSEDVNGADDCFIDCPAEKERGRWVTLENATCYVCKDCSRVIALVEVL